jgi:tRNA(Arg) A34 adenosine deaminase TadA
MKQALSEAHKAAEKDEVPIGAVIVCQEILLHVPTTSLRL